MAKPVPKRPVRAPVKFMIPKAPAQPSTEEAAGQPAWGMDDTPMEAAPLFDPEPDES